MVDVQTKTPRGKPGCGCQQCLQLQLHEEQGLKAVLVRLVCNVDHPMFAMTSTCGQQSLQ